MIIDDFKTGAVHAMLFAGDQVNYKATASQHFPVRYNRFFIGGHSPHQPGTFDVGSSELLTVGAGPHVGHRLELGYGYKLDGSPNPLHLNLSKFTGFRVRFDINYRPLASVIQIFTGGNYSQANCPGILPILSPTKVDVPFSLFNGTANLAQIDTIVFIANSDELGGGGYKITSFEIY